MARENIEGMVSARCWMVNFTCKEDVWRMLYVDGRLIRLCRECRLRTKAMKWLGTETIN